MPRSTFSWKQRRIGLCLSVSTPEQGSHVRFDIRPLQEFFAAEFIYESVNSETFSKRLEIIAADSHWREVMHFVLSALIENDRQTELTVAISALERLNEGNGETDNRLLSHRLGIGAILASRLLLEGVLEQDKRIRQRFRMTLEPLCATTDRAALSPMAAVEQPASRTWLRNLLTDSLQESKPSENVGAAILAVRILEDSAEKLDIVKRAILSCPPDYRSLVLTAIDVQHCKGRVWLVEMALRSLISPDWLQLTPRGIRAALNILAENHEVVRKVASTCGITTQIAEFLLTLLDVTKRRHDGESSARSESHGFVTLTYYPNALTLQLSRWSEETWLELSQSTGILRTIYLVLKFYSTRSRSYLLSLCEEAGPDCLNTLPEAVSACLPTSLRFKIGSSVDRLRSLTEDAFRKWVEENLDEGLRIEFEFRRLANPSLQDWKATIGKNPNLALMLWDAATWQFLFHGTRPPLLDSAGGHRCLNRGVSTAPGMFVGARAIVGKTVTICCIAPSAGTKVRNSGRVLGSCR